MSQSVFSILFAILAYFGWGVGDAVSVRLFRKNTPELISIMGGLFRFGIWILLIPFFWKDIGAITLFPFLFNILAGFGSGLGYYFFGKAARSTNSSLVSAIGGGWGVSALILSLVFLNERMSAYQWFAALFVFFGLYIVCFPHGLYPRKIKIDKGTVYAVLAFVMWGICGAFLKIPARSYGFYWTSIIMLIPYLFVVFFDIRKTNILKTFHIADFRYFIVMIVCTVLADIGYNGSLALGGNVAIAGTIAGSYATLTTFLTFKFYKEKLSQRQVFGIIISLIGIILTAYFSSL